MAFGAEVDECGFQAGLYAGDFAFVDVGFFLLMGAGFDVEVVEFLSVHNGDAQLFGVSRVDQYSFHGVTRLGPEHAGKGARQCVTQGVLEDRRRLRRTVESVLGCAVACSGHGAGRGL